MSSEFTIKVIGVVAYVSYVAWCVHGDPKIKRENEGDHQHEEAVNMEAVEDGVEIE